MNAGALDSEIHGFIARIASNARQAAGEIAGLTDAQKSDALRALAGSLRQDRLEILRANALDVSSAQENNLAAPLIERLKLNESKVEAMARSVEQIAAQTDPVGQTLEGYVRPNGLRIEKRRVPIGVVLFFYESRPNVTSDAAALCLKSGNAVILRGGKEALHSNRAIAKSIAAALTRTLPGAVNAVQFIDNPDRALVPILLKQNRHIDLVIPRGGESLIRAVVAGSTIPVLKHFTGNCHIYIDAGAEALEDQVVGICVNAKTSYPGGAVCNAVEHLLIHKDVSPPLVNRICQELAAKKVEVRGDGAVCKIFPSARPAADQDWETEYLDLIVGVKVVDSLDAAIDHINTFGSHHTDAILSTSIASIERFVTRVDSASVLVNASTRFADGGEYGLGAEIGISTDKLHARGPMGAADLTTYKWIVTGSGHVRL